MAAMYVMLDHPQPDLSVVLDDTMSHLEAGLLL